MAIAPSNFGSFAGDLLVGNFGDGRINASTIAARYSFAGQLQGASGPLAIDGLWGLTVGNNGSAGSSGKLYFSAGPQDEANGLFGVIVPEPSTILLAGTLLSAGVAAMFGGAWWRRRQAV